LNCTIKRITKFQLYGRLVMLVHQKSMEWQLGHQLQEDQILICHKIINKAILKDKTV
jgi:hypothetical protein